MAHICVCKWGRCHNHIKQKSHLTMTKCEYNKTVERFAFIQVDYQKPKTNFLELPSLLQMNQRLKQNGIQCFLFT
jgi:hypothetical protein